jgi:Family of unknown function (DUF5519)
MAAPSAMVTNFESLAAGAPGVIALVLTFVTYRIIELEPIWNAMSDSDKLGIFMLFIMVLTGLVILGFIQPLISNLADWIRKDYQAFINLGPGGTSRTPWGWFRLKMLGILRLKSVFEPPQVSTTVKPFTGMLSSLPQRDGPHPTFRTLSGMLEDIAAEYPTRLRVGTSLFDKKAIALFVSPERGEVVLNHALFEIAHPHRIDGSMHLIMHPADIKAVVENKWGEQHSMVKADCWWLRWFVRLWGTRPPVPEELVLIYAPRNEKEVEVVRTLVEAAASWVTGVDLYPE